MMINFIEGAYESTYYLSGSMPRNYLSIGQGLVSEFALTLTTDSSLIQQT
jgi:hypothetical protein